MGLIEEIELLDADETRETLATVHRLRPYWEHRHATAPFYTLGAPSYLDAMDPAAKRGYYERAERLNPVLKAHFPALYERLAARLGEHFGEPFEYEARFGLPGFHVFLPDRVFEEPVASVHVDLQYQLVDWLPEDEPDFTRPLSFTASFCLPRSGAGLNTWSVRYDDLQFLDRSAMERKVKETAPDFHPYRIGWLVLHSGHTVHQIAPMKGIDPDNPADARITLQGHAVRCRGVWKIYW